MALVILLQETHCTSVRRLVLRNYQLAGFFLSRNHGLATFAHERLKWTLFHQSPPTSETECLYVDVEVYKIVNVYTPLQFVCKYPISQYSHIPVSMLASLIASMLIGIMMPTVLMENASLAGQVPTILPYFITQRMPLASTPGAGIQVPTRILHSLVSIRTVVYITDRS